MQVILAKTAGFCFGVQRAVDLTYEQIGRGKVCTYGPIIHNEEVVADLCRQGVHVIEDPDALGDDEGVRVVIRSHGVSRETLDRLRKKDVCIVDATCPFVKKIHQIVEKEGMDGRTIIIIGNNSHPEVEATKGWCTGPVYVIETAKEAEAFCADSSTRISVVAQTTFNYNKFKELVEILRKKGYDIRCLNTICNATQERQEEAQRIAAAADTMIVIGGRHSSNTQKLFEICRKECDNTYYIQTINDLDLTQAEYIGNVGITAGASTPKNIIEEVHKACLK